MQQAIDSQKGRSDLVQPSLAGRELWENAVQPLLIGQSGPMQKLMRLIQLVGDRRCTVLVTGETGTGKEVVARTIHQVSSRSRFPMVAINCAAIPDNLLEAELFGHVKGAFTGATANRIGRFEQAHQSTLFLDEIGDMPLELQTKLLRVLQEREFQRVGSSDVVKIDVRVIAATNVDLLQRVKAGKFREDLYYRLHVVPFFVPPLRERRDDIVPLATHFIRKVCLQEKLPLKQLSEEAAAFLGECSWPGNVRQLENTIEMAVVLSGTRTLLTRDDFALSGDSYRKPVALTSESFIPLPDDGIDFEATISQIELNLLEQALRRANGNKKLAADMLRLKRTTLAAKLKSFDSQLLCP